MEEETQYCGTPSATPEEPVNLELEPCGFCGRTFIPTTLAKHINICQKMATKKRKQFDSFRQRREGTDLAVFLPKNYGLPTPKHDEPKQSPPKANQNTSVAAHRQIDNTPKQVTPVEIKKPMTSKVSPPTSGLQSTVSKEKVKPKSVTKLPQNEKCPHCERHFGAKAYERHVEWCKEKTRLSTNQNNSNLSAAKERLQARTKYRAPNLKTKRGLLREKYSGVNCEEVNNEFPDGIFDHAPQTPSANRDELKITMSTSLSSSIMSDGGFSDKYDPFLSAKRQLEELCSPTSTIPSISPTVPKTKQRTSSLSSSISSSSNPRNSLSAVKSNFRRTSSLRGPRKPSTRPIFIPPTLQKPTIQRGLSDEGPISSKFLKPEEYDEMPVKSVCINDFASTHSPKVIKRDSNSSINRRNLRLNLSKPGTKLVNGVPLSKTDSLAIFLRHENEAKQKDSPVDLTEKDLKDKSNTLSKQSSQKSLANTLPSNNKENIPSLKDSITNMLESQNSFNQNQSIDLNSKPMFYNKNYAIRLEPLPQPPSPKSSSNHSSKNSSNNINLSSILDFKDNDYIDPKLINVCDNLPLGVSKLSDSDLTSSSNESACPPQVANDPDPQTQYPNPFLQTPSNRNSTEKRNLKRQIRLGKNQFLYDMSPDSDPYSVECDKTISVIESNNKFLSPSLNEPPFDDFDIEEFLSSFDHDDDQFPIFKDCKEFLLNRSFNKHCNNLEDPSSESPSTMNRDYQDKDANREIFITIETSPNECSPSPCDPPSYPQEDETDKNGNPKTEVQEVSKGNEKQDTFEDFGDSNRNSARNINKLYCQNDSGSPFTSDAGKMMYAADSDEISSIESYPVRQGSRGKLNSDSAYGSLSRHSAEQRPVRRSSSKTRMQSATSILEQPVRYKSLQKIESKPRNRNTSASSSGSEAPVLPILPQEGGRQEKESQFRKDMRMSKFCYECGSKFLISQAKFCMECGVKRIVLD